MNLKKHLIALTVAVIGLAASTVCLAADVADSDFKPLFDGRSLEGWDGNPDFWSVKDGLITGQTTAEKPTSGNTFLIWRGGEVGDFELRLTYKIVGGNSGIQYRSKDHDKWVVGGYQADIDSGDTFSGILYEERGRGVLCGRGERTTIGGDGKKQTERVADSGELQHNVKKEDWNEYVVIAKGNHLVHKINGKVTAEVTDEENGKNAASGILALQLHAGPPMTVQFKDVRIAQFKSDGKEPAKDAAAGDAGGQSRKRIVMVAGTPSHGPGDHEFNAGTLLLAKCLKNVPQVEAVVHLNGWPKDEKAFEGADAIFLYMDGGGGHPVIQRNRLTEIDQLMKKGVGLACAHYAVEVPKEKGGPDFLKWIGGYYESGYSINPHWDGNFTTIPEHPITRGVQPFKINDEWYYNIRFPESASVTTLLEAVPPDGTRGTDAARQHQGRSEVVAWAYDRENGGRGFGFTGGHNHENWGNDSFRKLVLNAMLWVAKVDVPEKGVESTVTEDELKANLDPK